MPLSPANESCSVAAAPTKPEEEDEYFELLPPGCSMKDPTYHYGRNSLSDPVLNYDQKPVEDYKPLKKRQPVPAPPLNVAAAKAKLDEKAVEKKKAQGAEQEEDDDMYVYLPPGSSMRDPLPSSLSDPLDNRRVYYRDPNPTLRK
ncbi:sodium channel type 4 subunit alpha isoform X2 [Micractinium conductrix]|uniref:Sodium channel type 4 subunit alpha isoform X2 n=1 Tax=Micractinium conductrix TaxID=554055 RepID=A0A2P6V0I9_9CHLO|nr:sodium channel type 4 subunit alpha isoform X2 [Micractinium conductrix]|eukprot:PSC67593.1 sodium channel type 4 subunit alpha isoform X2 [Micractinium conductrix]